MALGSAQPVTEMSKGRSLRETDNLTAICEPIVLENVGASMSHNAVRLHSLLQG
jgi:hypothetical protein